MTAVAKSLVEADRNASARESNGYLTLMGKLCRLGASTKNDVIIGLPKRLADIERSILEVSVQEEAKGPSEKELLEEEEAKMEEPT